MLFVIKVNKKKIEIKSRKTRNFTYAICFKCLEALLLFFFILKIDY